MSIFYPKIKETNRNGPYLLEGVAFGAMILYKTRVIMVRSAVKVFVTAEFAVSPELSLTSTPTIGAISNEAL